MKEKLPKILLVFISALVLINLVYLDYKFFLDKKTATKTELELETETTLFSDETSSGRAEQGSCGVDCQELIDQKISEAIGKIPTQKPGQSVTYVVPTVASTQTRVSYIPLATEATVNSVEWKDISASDFYFDLSDYIGVKNVRLEVYLKSQHQAGKLSIRLYDVTNKRGVDYSDLSSSSESFELQRSSDLSIWRGNNLYRLQGKTQSGIEGYLKDAKLKITF